MNSSPGKIPQRSLRSPDRHGRTGSLQLRLTLLALVISIPLLGLMTYFLTDQTRVGLTEAANQTMSASNASINQATALWLDYNSRALKTFVTNPNVAAMNTLWQKPLLREMAENYPYLTLVSTTDVNGVNKTRSDDKPFEIFDDRYWFQNAVNGAPITYETLLVPGQKRPELVVSMPIQKPDGTVVGVGMFTANLEQIYKWIESVQLGRGGSSFVIDQRNIMVAHSNPAAPILSNMSGHPAVKALRSGVTGDFAFTDKEGERSQSYLSLLPNGWAVITLQTEAGLFGPVRQFEKFALIGLVVSTTLITLLSWSTIRRTLRPVQELTETAAAISQGDLNRRAEVRSRDEVGVLAMAFNGMTDQLSSLIATLEARVAERTRALERRLNQLQVTAQVAGEAAGIRESQLLLQNVTGLISERFGFDHAGIFIVEQAGQTDPAASIDPQPGYAVLRAASSEGGRKMLERSHRLRIGRQGIVGFVAASGIPRIALDVGSDAVFFNNPDLPLTRSELALPLKIQDKVIGVLDVQSNQESAFTEEDSSILQILADQVALAIQNARLLAESQQSLHELETLYGQKLQAGWRKRLADQALCYDLDHRGVTSRTSQNLESGLACAQPSADQDMEAVVPISLRGHQIGALRLRRDLKRPDWSQEERELIQLAAGQLALSLENARLMDEIRGQAQQEELISQVVARTQASLSLQTVMQTAVEEIGRLFPVSKIQIRLDPKTRGLVSSTPLVDQIKPPKNGSKNSGNGSKKPAALERDR